MWQELTRIEYGREHSKSISDAGAQWCASMVSERDGLHFHQVERTLRRPAPLVLSFAKESLLQYEPVNCQFCGIYDGKTTTVHIYMYLIGNCCSPS